MMKMWRLSFSLALLLVACSASNAQAVNATQSVTLEGLRSSASQGSFPAAAYAADGSLFLLLDEQDGIRLLKTDATGNSILAESQLGTNGDAPIALSVDPGGNLYVVGTSSSGTLSGTSDAAFPSIADGSTNSFLAKYDANLHLTFLTFFGAGRTAATSVAATADAVFVTGITFNPAFPVSASAAQQSPASGTFENGFVERFATDGSTLIYSTFLTGANGSTIPAAIVADASDNAYIAGATSSSAYPTGSALQPSMLLASGAGSSGFLTRLNADGSTFVFSTYIAGNGITSLALDPTTSSLVLTGNIALGQFPVATVTTPITSASYQTLLRIPFDGQSVTTSIVLVPGTQSFVAVGPEGDTWISGALTTPLFPGNTPPAYNTGDSFLLHLTAEGVFDRTLRFGGTPVNNANEATLSSNLGTPALNGPGVALPGSIAATLNASLLTSQRFDLPMAATPSSTLPSVLRDLAPTNSTCGTSSQCTGTGGLLAMVNTSASAPTLSVSSDDLPNLTLRNLGSAPATNLTISVTGFNVASNCGTSLNASGQCSLALSGSGPGTLTISATNAATVTVALPVTTVTPSALALSTTELDFGILTSLDNTLSQTITVTNLTTSAQTFTSTQDGATGSTAYTVAETASDCASGGSMGVHLLAANSSCHISIGLTVAASSITDMPVHTTWTIADRDVVLTGFAQVTAINLSAPEIDFGTQFSGSALQTPRYLYLSNNSASPIPHSVASLPAASPFTVTDACPSVLAPHSVCQIKLTYRSPIAPSADTATLMLDQGSSVLITGSTLPQTSLNGSTTNPALSVSANALSFPTPVVVTQLASTLQILTIVNTGSTPFPLTFAISGDFNLVNGCPATLAGGGSCLLQIGFAPSQPGERDGVLSVTAGSGFTPTYISLTGTGAPILPPNDGTLDLAQTLVGEPIVVWYKVQQPIVSLTASSNSSLFGLALVPDTGSGHGSLAASSFSQTITPNCNNCWLGVQFFSQVAGQQSATLTLTSTPGGNPYLLTLTGTALPVQGVLLTPSLQDFGTVAVNSSSGAMIFTLTNMLATPAPVTVQSVTARGDFIITPNSTGGASCAGTLAATASCFVQVAFAPASSGDRSGSLMIVTSSGTIAASLTGYGTTDEGLAINPTSLTFSNVPGTTSTRQSITLSNTGTAAVAIGAPSVSDPSFSLSSNCATLQPAAACTVTVEFTPQTSTVAATLSLPVTSTANEQTTTATYTVALSGAYTSVNAGLQIVASGANYGAAQTGASASARLFTINNLTNKSLTMSLSLPRQFPLTAVAPCPTLAAGASCSFSVSFFPVTGGPITGTVLAEGTPTDGSAQVQALAYMQGYGSASGSLLITGNTIPNAPLSFGQVRSGDSAHQVLTLTNNGNGPLTIRRITTEPPFFSTSTCGTTLSPNASCTVALTYAPIYEVAASGTATPRTDAGVLSIESDAISSPDTLILGGIVTPIVSSAPAIAAILSVFALSQSSLTFANTQVGDASAAQAVTLTNTGTTTIHVFSTVLSNDFTSTTHCATLLPGAACSFTVQFTPTTASTSIVRSGTLEILSDSGTSLEFISLVGISQAPTLTLSPTALNFGTVNLSSSAAMSLTVTNTGRTPATFLGLTASGDYTVASGSCPALGSTLAAGDVCVLTVTFKPTATGTRTGTLSLTSDATQLPLTASLSGVSVVAQLKITPGSLAFVGVDVGFSASLTLTLLNAGTASVTGISNTIGGPNAPDFAVTAPCSTPTLAPNQGCTETITFTPSAASASAATLTIASSDPNSPATIPMTGTGLKAGSFALTVNGATAATATVNSGSPGTYALLLTPADGFTGTVALTCAPVSAGEYTSCSLLASTLTLGSTAQSSTATINTITSNAGQMLVGFSGLLLTPLALFRRRKGSRKGLTLSILAVLFSAGFLSLTGCGGPPTTASDILTTPPGTYQYQVTASSTSGAVISSTVTLTLVVR